MKPYNGFTPAERMRAFRWLKLEYAAGRRSLPTRCDACLQEAGVVEPHSEDYGPPYGDHIGQFGFCYRCHMFVHCRYKNPEAWNHYRQAVREGWRFAAMYARVFGPIVAHLEGILPARELVNPPRARTVLDEIHDGEHDPRPSGERPPPVEPEQIGLL